MNSRLRLLIFIGLPVAILAYLNPGYNEFYGYIQKQVELSGDSIDRPFRDLVAGISKNTLKEAREQGVVRKDYGIFSIFEIQNPNEKKVHRVLGFGKKIFIPLNEIPKRKELIGEF